MSAPPPRARGKSFSTLSILVAAGFLAPPATAQWVQFVDETATRVSADPGHMASDPQEKDYAWGDVDNDGDVDLVVVRKEPFTTPGKYPNYLFLNEGGVLTDRTQEFATQSTVSGDQGFLTSTNDRDVALADVDNDGWLDIVTAVAISDGDPKYIGHPRVYRNLGCVVQPCDGTTATWGGFRYEEDRIPTMLTWSGQSGFNPRFCSVYAADVTGDGYVDLWFSDHDNGVNAIQPPGADFNDRLLINEGASNPGYFFDATQNPSNRFNADFPVSAFGAAASIADMNGDGANDIVKQTALQTPQRVAIGYNDPDNEGFFATDVVYTQLPYFVSTGDLNNDDRLDLVITDDGADRYLLNSGNGPDGYANFITFAFAFNHTGPSSPPSNPGDDGFGSNSVIADLDKDGWNDVLIADVDVDTQGCARRMHIYRNLGNPPNVTLEEQTTGTSCNASPSTDPSCLVTGIPADSLAGTHDVAVFDINGDSWPDMVVGRCNGTEVWINQPPVGPAGAIPADQGPSEQLLLGATPMGETLQLDLSWGPSCILEDTDYEVYEGTLDGTFDNHHQVTCSTSGSTSFDLQPQSASSYYLVVPHNGTYEGSYGHASDGTPRQQGADACRPMVVGSCE